MKLAEALFFVSMSINITGTHPKVHPPISHRVQQSLNSFPLPLDVGFSIEEPYQLADRTNFYALVNKSVKFNARDG